jgi:transcriptional regulator with XRE-family HTH domain
MSDAYYYHGMKTNGVWTAKDGRRLLEFRKRQKWSQENMADQLGCNQATVSRIEHGYPPPRPIRRLIEILTKETA